MKKNIKERGFVKAIILIVIALLIVSYFGLNIRSVANSDAGKDNFSYVKEIVLNIWTKYLKRPVNYVWNDIFLNLIWEPAIDSLNKLKDGKPSAIEVSAPRV